MDLEYLILDKRIVEPGALGSLSYDLFISAFNASERVQRTFQSIQAARKVWLIHPEYRLDAAVLPGPADDRFAPADGLPETEYWGQFMGWLGQGRLGAGTRVAVDITGMLRPHILLLPLFLQAAGVQRADFIYSDPLGYASGASTVFSKGVVERVSQIPALEGSHDPRIADEVLVIGAGYDARLVAELARSRAHAKHLVVLGLPGLQPHMYQESQLQVAGVGESISRLTDRSFYYCAANDPWLTAATLSDIVENARAAGPVNLYLAPVGPKTQVLGFGWYFLTRERRQPSSMIFPYTSEYSQETSHGLARTHIFGLELDWIPDA